MAPVVLGLQKDEGVESLVCVTAQPGNFWRISISSDYRHGKETDINHSLGIEERIWDRVLSIFVVPRTLAEKYPD